MWHRERRTVTIFGGFRFWKIFRLWSICAPVLVAALGWGRVSSMGAQVKAPSSATAAPQTAARMMARTVPVPDFYGKTFQQVQAEVARVVPGSQSTMFARVTSQGPADGVVASQYPVRDTPVIPGATRLLVTLQAPKPSKFSTFVDQVATALAAPKTYDEQKMVTVPGLLGQTRAVASQKLAVLQLRGSYTGNDAGVVAQQYPVAGESVKPRSVVVVTMALQSVIVPPLYGLSLPEAVRKLQVASLLNGVVYGSSGAGSNVIAQSITPGAQVPPGTAVNVTMRAAPLPDVATPDPLPPPAPKVTVPNVVTMTGVNAADSLQGLGLRVGPWRSPANWLVSSQRPAAGTEVEAGSEVFIRLGAPTVVVPDLRRDDEATSRSLLKLLGLAARISYALHGDVVGPHVVVDQSPVAGAVVAEGSTVDVTMGYDPPPVTGLHRVWNVVATAVPLAPWWVWLAIALPIGGVGLRVAGRWGGKSTLPTKGSVPAVPAVCSLTSTRPSADVRVAEQGPGLRFKITLHDAVGRAEIRTVGEPAVTRRG